MPVADPAERGAKRRGRVGVRSLGPGPRLGDGRLQGRRLQPALAEDRLPVAGPPEVVGDEGSPEARRLQCRPTFREGEALGPRAAGIQSGAVLTILRKDRKSTRLNSSHANISYAVFCLKKKK